MCLRGRLVVVERASGGGDGDTSTSDPQDHGVNHDGDPVARPFQREVPWGSVKKGWGKVGEVVQMVWYADTDL